VLYAGVSVGEHTFAGQPARRLCAIALVEVLVALLGRQRAALGPWYKGVQASTQESDAQDESILVQPQSYVLHLVNSSFATKECQV
jgi:hypothetical protein